MRVANYLWLTNHFKKHTHSQPILADEYAQYPWSRKRTYTKNTVINCFAYESHGPIVAFLAFRTANFLFGGPHSGIYRIESYRYCIPVDCYFCCSVRLGNSCRLPLFTNLDTNKYFRNLSDLIRSSFQNSKMCMKWQ